MYKLKPATKNTTGLTLRSLSDITGTDKNNFLHNSLLTNREFTSLGKGFVYKSSNDINLSKTQLSKIIWSGGLLGGL